MLPVKIKPAPSTPMTSMRHKVPQDKGNELREGFGDGSRNGTNLHQ